VPELTSMVGGVPDPCARRRWTYAQLLAEAERAARALTARFAPGERVAVWAPNLPDWVILEYAAALAGLVLVTVNPAFRPEELAYVLNQSGSAGTTGFPKGAELHHRGLTEEVLFEALPRARRGDPRSPRPAGPGQLVR
jgi:acyl-CoA synthetase (AMP-forming)/AMP-acid ligase II